jgi:hypothetical protein
MKHLETTHQKYMIGEQQSQGLNHMKSRGGLKVLQILAHISNCITLYNSDVGETHAQTWAFKDIQTAQTLQMASNHLDAGW